MKKYSLCCISLELQKKGIKSSTMTKTRFLSLDRKLAIDTVSKRTLNNLKVVKETLKYCISKKWNYRISSGLMPLETLPEARISYDILPDKDYIYDEFKQCSEIIKKNNLRCSTHPDQFTVPASSKPNVVSKAIIELNAHGLAMDLFGLPQSYQSPINIHMNCYKGEDIKTIADRFIKVYKQLNNNVKSRLVLELEDKPNSWNLNQLYNYIYEKVGIPITYDSHHFRLNNPDKLNPNEAIKKCISTWGKYQPLFHFSNGRDSKENRAHSDYVYDIHQELFDNNVDIEFEFKMKDMAINEFTKNYPSFSNFL
jgi:UV DNA damage endonuclease